jgi:hypothetical protein
MQKRYIIKHSLGTLIEPSQIYNAKTDTKKLHEENRYPTDVTSAKVLPSSQLFYTEPHWLFPI